MAHNQVTELLLNLTKTNNILLKHNDDHYDDGDGGIHFHDHTEGHYHNATNTTASSDDDHDETSVNIAKATAMVTLFCASTLCGSIPFILNKWFKWTENNTNARSAIIVKCLLYFGGGVLLSTTFLHLLPEVTENIESLQSEHRLPKFNFHLPELLVCLGFFAMYFVEEIIHAYIHRHQRNLNENSAELAFERGRSIRNSYLVKGKRTRKNSNSDNDSVSNNGDNIMNVDITTSKTSGLSVQDLIKNDVESQKYEAQAAAAAAVAAAAHHLQHHHHLDHHEHGHAHHHHHHYNVHEHNDHDHHHHHHNHHHGGHGHGHSHLPIGNTNGPNNRIDDDMIVTSLRGLLIVLALSLHELFEGLAVGLEASAGNVWYMFGAVSAHKLVLAFCVGVELIVTRTKLWLSIVYVITFAIVSPIGIGIGIVISNEESAASAIPSAILQGLATGTLLYVVFFEILSKEKSGLIAYVAFLIGFFFMFTLQFISGHEHTHSHGGHHHGDEHNHNHDHLKLSDNAHIHHDHHQHEITSEDDGSMSTTTETQLKLLKEATEQFTTALAKSFNK